MINKYRTHNCGELRKINVGNHVKLAGWVSNIRQLGGIIFVTLRDHYGVTQCLVKDEKLIENICKESTVSVSGKVIERESKNPAMPTGDIEVMVDSMELLGKCKSVLPFEVIDSSSTKEELRLKYRYIDLRNADNHAKIVLRSELLHSIRNQMHNMGFTEVQTPILTSSSPEGARDFLVPSRLNPGMFYALPQAPQQFKQLLMISGFDKYFQLAPCFRDEDARADRSPGEFYQMDMEMSFATQEDVFEVIENVMQTTFTKFSNNKITSAPFERIKYADSMAKYCSDKPDLRNPLVVEDLSRILENSECVIFKNKTIKAIKAPAGEKTRKFFDEMTKFITDNEGKGLAYIKVLENNELNGSVVKFLSEEEQQNLIKQCNVKQGDVIFIIADSKVMATKLAGALRNKLGEELELIDKNKFHFCWIVDFPFYEYDEENNCIAFSHNPFSMPQGELNALLNDNPLDIVAYQYDLVLNGVELASGAVRNHDPEIMKKAFEIAGYSGDVVENKFPALYNAFQYGAPPHAGLAFGFDRVVMFLAGINIIRDVIAFPLNKSAQDLMMGAPSTATEKQLREVHVKVREKD